MHYCSLFFSSLKKGRIFSITHKLPVDCPFASYEELRKHWKLMVRRVTNFNNCGSNTEHLQYPLHFILFCTVWIQTSTRRKRFLQHTFLLHQGKNIYVSFTEQCFYSRHECFSGKCTTRKFHAKLHPGP